MSKLKLFSREHVGNASDAGRQYSRPDSLSLVSRQSVLAFLLVLLTTIFGVGNVWGETFSQVYDYETQGSGTGKTWTLSNCTDQTDYWQCPTGNNITTSVASITGIFTGKTITSDVTITISNGTYGSGTNPSAKTFTIYNSSACTSTSQVTASNNGTFASSKTYVNTVYTVTAQDAAKFSNDLAILITKPGKTIRLNSITVAFTYTPATGGSTEPTGSMTPDPTSVDVTAEGDDNGSISITYEGITDKTNINVVKIYSDAEHTVEVTNTIDWLIADWNADKTAVEYVVAANTGAERTAYIYLYALDDEANSVEVVIPVTQAKYAAPTGTFELFSGDLVEGDYVFVVDAKAMTNSESSNRLTNTDVTIAANQIANPDGSVIWHVAASGDYWTIYNAAVEKYAASTGAANKAQVTATADDKILWAVEKSSNGYNFNNKYNSGLASPVNSKLQRNGDYGWACYAAYSNISLYKKQVAGQPKAPTFSVEGGNYESAQSVELSCETEGATIYYTTNGDAPTSSSTQYNGTAIAVDHTMTIKAIAIKNEISSTVASATYTIIVWQTVADVWDDITADGPKNAHIYGYVSQVNVGGYDNNFYISDNGSTEGNQLYAYRMNMNSFSVAVGDKVKLAGDLMDYQGTKEFKYANSGATQGLVVALEARGALQSVAVSGSPTKTEYASGEEFNPAGLKVFGTYANGFVGEITEGITWGNDLTGGKVTESTTVQVTATVGGVTSAAHEVAVTVAAKTLVSIAAIPESYTIYKGQALPKPTIIATYSDGESADVSADAFYDTESEFDKTTADTYTITVSYTFGEPKTATYEVTVKEYANDAENPYTVAEATQLIESVFADESTDDIYVHGIVSKIVEAYQAKYGNVTYNISDDGTTSGAQIKVFRCTASSADDIKEGDEVIVKGHAIYYQSSTPELLNTPTVVYLARTPNFEIADVASLEVGGDDLAVADLTITKDGEGEVTLASSDKEEFVTIEGGKLHAVAPGTATITANLAANGIYKAATYEFSVTVIAAQVKYAITFDGNGADGGEDPEAIADKVAGVEVTLPANTWTKTGFTFTGWKVINNTTSAEVEVVAGAFEMPASAVTIQAQWAEIPVWAYRYTSNITVGTDIVKFSDEPEAPEYAAKKTGTSSAWGSTTVTVPVSTSKLHFHAVCYGADTYAVTLKVKKGDNVLGTFNIKKDEGAKGSSPFTLANTPYEQYYSVTLADITEPTTITFEAESGSENGKRFIIFGVNQEGGIVPVLDHIVVTGTATELEYEVGDVFNPAGLGANAIYTLGGVEQEPVAINAKDIEWSFEPATIAANTTAVTVTATYEGMSDQTNVPVTVTVPEPEIIVSAASLAFNNVAKGAAVADKELTVTLKSVENATLTITGDGASAFSVTPAALTASETVAVSASSANVGTFNATLTISDDAGEAEVKTVALSITVEASDDLSGTWNLVTDAAELMPGMQVIIANVADGEGNLYTLGGPNGTSANNRLAVASTATGNVLNPAEGTKVITLVDAGNGKYALQLVNGNYLCAASSSSNNLKEQTTNDANGQWTITIADGKATITAQGSYSRKLMRFNPNNGNPLFSCYASGQQDIVLYAKPFDYTRNVSGNYGTICLPKAGQIIGATLYEVADKDDSKIYFDEILNGQMEAGKPYIFLPNGGESQLAVYYTSDEEKGVQPANGLVGFIGDNEEDDMDVPVGMYILNNNQYRLVEYAGSAKIKSYRSYINLGGISSSMPAPGRRRISMSYSGSQVATGIDQVPSDQVPSTKVIIDGQLFLIRGEKMYDAKGQLVK